MPDSRIKIKKSAGIKRQEKKGIVTPGSKKYFKVKVKSTDPGGREGAYTSIKKTEITEKKANKLASKAPRKNIENPGKLARTVEKVTNKPSIRYGGSKVASGKSNLNLKGKALKMFVGKEGVARAEAKKPNNQYERATTGTQKFVTTKNSDSPVETPKPKFDPNSNRTKNKQTVGEIKKDEQSSQTPKTSVGSGPTINKKRTPTVTQTYGKGGMKVTYPK